MQAWRSPGGDSIVSVLIFSFISFCSLPAGVKARGRFVGFKNKNQSTLSVAADHRDASRTDGQLTGLITGELRMIVR